uniref:TRASH domain-containing protein n=1 Tax=Zea mays TaxID=4577 RepID=C4J151_MAIZE|nr:unknown [Zea mays]
MVLKTELCRFSGQKIYPGKGIRFIRADSQVFLFANSKCKRYFHNRLKPAKLTWTAMYRKQHKKDIHAEAVKKRRRPTWGPWNPSGPHPLSASSGTCSPPPSSLSSHPWSS